MKYIFSVVLIFIFGFVYSQTGNVEGIIIDENNQDNYPLMKPVCIPRLQPLETWITVIMIVTAVVVAAILIYFTKIRKTKKSQSPPEK